tara:strand:+ start:410 stop:2776 length:2367 start_codon:yes stop_codon:yes gene_type:complete
MSFVKLDGQNFEVSTILLKPSTKFVSSSLSGLSTGSAYVAPTRSKCIKQIIDLESAFWNLAKDATDGDSNVSKYNIDNFKRALAHERAIANAQAGDTNLTGSLSEYLSLIDEAPKDVRFDKYIDIFRFDPPFSFTKNTTVKNITRKVLMPYHMHRYENCGFYYTNYNTLNFFNNETIPSGSALIYPNVTGAYDLPDTFSLNFWLNPRYSSANRAFNAGTIFHLSSSIAVSLVSGSSVNRLGEEQDFKILLQLSHSADIPPSSISLNSPTTAKPRDLIFTSSHTLKKNNWHHVSISWGPNSNNATGSLFIDNNETKFYVPSASLSSSISPNTMVIGNFLDMEHTQSAAFFHKGSGVGTSAKELHGVTEITTAATQDPTIKKEQLAHPLNAEVHDIRLYNLFIDKRLRKESQIGFTSPKNLKNLKAYIPPYFYPETRTREVLVTPFQTITSKTNDPFNVSFSFGVGGKSINLENFARDFVTGEYPRLVGLEHKTINTTVQNITADQYIYHTGSHIKRNLTLLPNDNGLHRPVYDILKNSPMSGSEMYRDPYNNVSNYSIINLDRLVPTSSLFDGLILTKGAIFDQIVGSSPDNPGVAPGAVLTIAQRTRDVSSNEISVFDISNLYYGNKIHPGSLLIKENNLTGSGGDVKIKVRDNSRGSLYRADCETEHAVWNNIGNVLYDEGVVVLKTPHLAFLGKDLLDMSFKGEQRIHTAIMNIPANEWNFTSSSNKTFKSIPPTTGANDASLETIYITGVNIHDDNFNVIMQASLAQPIFKTEEDEFIIRLKKDF